MEEKVSVIMPTYNRGYVIEDSVKSVLSQTYKNFEFIIVDDGSSDNTASVVEHFNDPRIKYHRLETNIGVSHARNVGLAISDGEFFSFLDSDNVWDNSFLESRMRTHKKTGANFVFGRMKLSRTDGTTAIVPDLNSEELADHEGLIKLMIDQNVVDMNTVLMRRDCFDDIRFNESMNALVDWDYFFRALCRDGVKTAFVDDVLVFNYLQNNSITLFQENVRADMYLIMLKSNVELLKKKNLFKLKIRNVYERQLLTYSIEESLKRLSTALSTEDFADFVAGIIQTQSKSIKRLENDISFSKRWIRSSLDKNKLNDYFKGHQIQKVCIYGYSLYGKLLEKIIKDCDVELSQVIDRNMDKLEHGSGPEYSSTYEKGLGENLIIVASSRYFDEIKDELAAVCDTKIISIEELL